MGNLLRPIPRGEFPSVNSPMVHYPPYIYQQKIKFQFFYLDKALRKGDIVKYTRK